MKHRYLSLLTLCLIPLISCGPSISEPTALVFNLDHVNLEVGKTFALSAKPNFGSEPVSYVSSNPDIVSVDGNGLLTAKALGDVKITATCGNLTSICPVRVYSNSPLFHGAKGRAALSVNASKASLNLPSILFDSKWQKTEDGVPNIHLSFSIDPDLGKSVLENILDFFKQEEETSSEIYQTYESLLSNVDLGLAKLEDEKLQIFLIDGEVSLALTTVDEKSKQTKPRYFHKVEEPLPSDLPSFDPYSFFSQDLFASFAKQGAILPKSSEEKRDINGILHHTLVTSTQEESLNRYDIAFDETAISIANDYLHDLSAESQFLKESNLAKASLSLDYGSEDKNPSKATLSLSLLNNNTEYGGSLTLSNLEFREEANDAYFKEISEMISKW